MRDDWSWVSQRLKISCGTRRWILGRPPSGTKECVLLEANHAAIRLGLFQLTISLSVAIKRGEAEWPRPGLFHIESGAGESRLTRPALLSDAAGAIDTRRARGGC